MPTAPRKVELPAEDAVYAPPDDATLDELLAMAEQARADAGALLADDAADAAAVAQAERYIAAIDAIRARSTELSAQAAEQAQRVADARARLNTPDDADPAKQDDDEPVPPPPAGAPAIEDIVSGDPAANQPALVASLRPTPDQGLTVHHPRNNVRSAALGNPPPEVPAPRRSGSPAYLTAAAEIRGFNAGATLDWAAFGQAAESRFNALPHPRPGARNANAGRTQLAIGSVHMETHDEALIADGKPNSDLAEADAAIEWAVSNHRLAETTGTDGSLTAAGGWCAPSETLYDLLDITTEDGMLDVPGITVTRGGVRYSLGPDFTAVYVTGTANFTRTEAQAIAGLPTKPMINIPCPSFTDNRMAVDGIYLSGDILSSKGYPEAYADYTQKALKAFAHYVNAASIAEQVTLSTTVDLSTAGPNRTGSATVELLGAVELQVTDMRYKNRLSMTQSVEVIMPFWLRGNIRTDLAKRAGWTNPLMITDADIRSWFTMRGATIQFVYDWQDAFTGVAAGFGAATAVAAWPATANVLIYPQGTFVRALDPVIELSGVYDSTLLATNQYVALFMEQGRLTLKRHWDSRNLKVATAALGNTSGPPAVALAGATL